MYGWDLIHAGALYHYYFIYISFNLVVQLRLMNCRFDYYEFRNHVVKNYSTSL